MVLSLVLTRPAHAHPLDLGYLRIAAAGDKIAVKLDVDINAAAVVLGVDPHTLDSAAIAARVGWMHGYKAGDADAGWSTAGHIVSTVSDLVGASALGRLDINGQRGDDWLLRADIGSRTDSERDVWHSRPSAAQAFSPLRQVNATPATDSARPVPGAAAPQRQGRSR